MMLNLVFPYYRILSIKKSERERERKEDGKNERKESHSTWFLCYIGISTPTLPRYKTEIKSWKKRQKNQHVWKTAIKFRYRLILPQISSLKYAPVTSCVVEGSFSMFKNVMSYTVCMSLNEDNLEKLVVHSFKK